MSDLNTIINAIGDTARDKLIDLSGQVAVLAGHEYGITLTNEEINALGEVNLCVMTERALNVDDVLAQLQALPSVAAKINEKKTAAAVEAGHTEAIAGLSRTGRMNYARAHGLVASKGEPNKDIAVDHEKILVSLSPSNRISYARRHGLV